MDCQNLFTRMYFEMVTRELSARTEGGQIFAEELVGKTPYCVKYVADALKEYRKRNEDGKKKVALNLVCEDLFEGLKAYGHGDTDCLAHFARAAADCILMMDFAASEFAGAAIEQIKKNFADKLKEQAR